MRRVIFFCAACILLAISSQLQADDTRPTRAAYLAIAKQGWVFEFRSSLLRRGPDQPPVQFNGKNIATGAICIFGAPAHPDTRAVLVQFQHLLKQVFGRTDAFTFAGPNITDCAANQRVYLRLYDTYAPTGAFNADLRYLDDAFSIDLPKGRLEWIRSPAQGIGFFGRNGNVAHLLIRQPETQAPTALQSDFYRSILVEELFQVISYGVDILKFDPDVPFLSKLQEYPVHLRHTDWGSETYMTGLLSSNPRGLCGFDVFMLHALAQMKLDSSNSPDFLVFIETAFDDLLARTQTTLSDPTLTLLFDQSCLAIPNPTQP